MSLELAYRACNLCKKYAEFAKKRLEQDQMDTRYLELRDRANFKAMEAVVEANLIIREDDVDETISKLQEILKICAKCDYSSPNMAKRIEHRIRPKGKNKS